MSVLNPPPNKIPDSFIQNPDISRFIGELLRSVYTMFSRIRNVVEVLNIDSDAVGNVGAGEDDLITYSLPAGQLQEGQGIQIVCWGTTANNGNAKTLKLYFGSSILSVSMPTSVAGKWVIKALVFSTDTDKQDYYAELQTEDGSSNAVNKLSAGSLTEDDGAAITIKCTGQATSNNDIVQEGQLVKYLY